MIKPKDVNEYWKLRKRIHNASETTFKAFQSVERLATDLANRGAIEELTEVSQIKDTLYSNYRNLYDMIAKIDSEYPTQRP